MIEKEYVKVIQVKGEYLEPNSEHWVISIDDETDNNTIELFNVKINELDEQDFNFLKIQKNVWDQMNKFISNNN